MSTCELPSLQSMTMGAPAAFTVASNIVVDPARKSQFDEVIVQLESPGAPCAPMIDGALLGS